MTLACQVIENYRVITMLAFFVVGMRRKNKRWFFVLTPVCSLILVNPIYDEDVS